MMVLGRLAIEKEKAAERERQRRREIVVMKQAREDDIAQRVEQIQRVRSERQKDAREQRRRKQQVPPQVLAHHALPRHTCTHARTETRLSFRRPA